MENSSVVVGIGHALTVYEIARVSEGSAKVRLDPRTRKILAARRAQITHYVESQKVPAYGFNRGFGHNIDIKVESARVAELQRNLIRSHSAAVGEPLPRPVVRAAMLMRAHSIALGASGARPEVVEKIIQFLNAGITPEVPMYGSVGASGDLAPLSHIALALIGEGRVADAGRDTFEQTKAVLKRRGIKPLTLEMKEGLALNNGVQVSTALGLLSALKMRELLKVAVAATALTNQVMIGSDNAYDAELLALRPHPGAQVVGRWLRSLIKNSPLRAAHKPYAVDGEIQDPYNLRCAPQVLGSCYELIEDALVTFEREANSVTDNPLILPQRGNKREVTRIVSGGQFHGMPVAVKIYSLLQAMGIMARLSNMRCVRFVDAARNKGLPSDLVWPALSEAGKSTSSGMMIPEYVSAALTNAIWGAAMPSHLFSLSTDAGQEDHVSMSATLAVRVYENLPRLSELLAIELAFGAQAAAIRKQQSTIPSKQFVAAESGVVTAAASQLEKAMSASIKAKRFMPSVKVTLEYKLSPRERRLSPPCERLVAAVQKRFPVVKHDRELSAQLRALAGEVYEGRILQAIPAVMFR
ncbi:MAG: aromatic amino acid lyase [Proteobacteria bacterium]|nr:aromatic amino acid lyase [Pseudomonadota bacterium]